MTQKALTSVLVLALVAPVVLVASGGDPRDFFGELRRAASGAFLAHAASRSKPLDFTAQFCGCIDAEGTIVSTRGPGGTIVKEEPGQSASGGSTGYFAGTFAWQVTNLTVNQTTGKGREKGTAQVTSGDFNKGAFTDCRLRGKVSNGPANPDTNAASEGKLKCKEGSAQINRFKAAYVAEELACAPPQVCPPSTDPFRASLQGTVFFNPQ